MPTTPKATPTPTATALPSVPAQPVATNPQGLTVQQMSAAAGASSVLPVSTKQETIHGVDTHLYTQQEMDMMSPAQQAAYNKRIADEQAQVNAIGAQNALNRQSQAAPGTIVQGQNGTSAYTAPQPNAPTTDANGKQRIDTAPSSGATMYDPDKQPPQPANPQDSKVSSYYDESKGQWTQAPSGDAWVKDPMTGQMMLNSEYLHKQAITAASQPVISSQTKAAQEQAQSGADGGTITSGDASAFKESLGNDIQVAKSTPLPDPAKQDYSGNGTPPATTTAPGHEWEQSMPQDLQDILGLINDQMQNTQSSYQEQKAILDKQMANIDKFAAANEQNIKDQAQIAIDGQNAANAQALSMVKTRFAAMGGGGSQEVQYLSDTIASNQQALTAISVQTAATLNSAEQSRETNDLQLAMQQSQLAESMRKDYLSLATQGYQMKQDLQDKLLSRAAAAKQLEMDDINIQNAKDKSVNDRLDNFFLKGGSYDTMPQQRIWSSRCLVTFAP